MKERIRITVATLASAGAITAAGSSANGAEMRVLDTDNGARYSSSEAMPYDTKVTARHESPTANPTHIPVINFAPLSHVTDAEPKPQKQRTYPSKESADQLISEADKNRMKTAGWLGLLGVAIGATVGRVVYVSQKKREKTDKDLYLSPKVGETTEDRTDIVKSLEKNAVSLRELWAYGKDSMHRGTSPKHEYSTIDPHAFVDVARAIGLSGNRIGSTLRDFQERQEEAQSVARGPVDAYIIQAVKSKGHVWYRTKVGKRFNEGY